MSKESSIVNRQKRQGSNKRVQKIVNCALEGNKNKVLDIPVFPKKHKQNPVVLPQESTSSFVHAEQTHTQNITSNENINEEYPYQTTTKEIEKSVENDELDSVNRYDQNLMSRFLKDSRSTVSQCTGNCHNDLKKEVREIRGLCEAKFGEILTMLRDFSAIQTLHLKTPKKRTSIKKDRTDTLKEELHLPIIDDESLTVVDTCLLNDKIYQDKFLELLEYVCRGYQNDVTATAARITKAVKDVFNVVIDGSRSSFFELYTYSGHRSTEKRAFKTTLVSTKITNFLTGNKFVDRADIENIVKNAAIEFFKTKTDYSRNQRKNSSKENDGATQKSVRNVSPIRQVELESVIEAPSRNEIARVEPQDVTLATATQPQDVTLATATRALPFFTL